MSGVAAIIAESVKNGRSTLPETDGKRLLASVGIEVPRFVTVRDAEDVAGSLRPLQGPFAVKVLSPDILHKSDSGGVRLGLRDEEAVRSAVLEISQQQSIKAARLDGFLIEEMVAQGTEILIGAMRDPRFGPIVSVGIGGIFVELLEDVTFRICPISEHDADAMLDELRGAALLAGARGRPQVNRSALIRMLMTIGGNDGIIVRHSEIAEIDLNPVIAIHDKLIAVDARFILSQAKPTVTLPRPPKHSLSSLQWLEPLFAPRTVAVYGASTTGTTMANTFIRRIQNFGFRGEIYPIHPTAMVIEGLAAYPDLAQTPQPVDYAYIAINARHIPDILKQARDRLKFAQVISSGFAESEGGRALQQDLLEAAYQGGCRVLGPNCLGLYSPRGGITFPEGAPREMGSIGVVSQSGGLGTDIVKRGQWRGLKFSGLVTIGNSADISPTDLLSFYFEDPSTRAVGMYIEDIRQGREFVELLLSNAATKPVVILRGGCSEEGRAAAASHTGALAGGNRLWEALSRQTGCVMVDTVDEFIDALLVLQFYDLRPDRPTRNVVLFGNGGGTSVLGADQFSRAGLHVVPFTATARKALEALDLPPGTSVANPIDAPVRTLQEKEGRIAGEILDLVYHHTEFDALVIHLNLAAFAGRGGIDPINNLFRAVVTSQEKHAGRAHIALVLRSDGSEELDARKRIYRAHALDARIPVFDEIAPAALALRAVHHLEVRMSRRQGLRQK